MYSINLLTGEKREWVICQYEYRNFLITINPYMDNSFEGYAISTKYNHLIHSINDFLFDDNEIYENEDFHFFYEQPTMDTYQGEFFTNPQLIITSLVEEINYHLNIQPKTVILKEIKNKTVKPKSSPKKRGFLQSAWSNLVRLRDGKCMECSSVYDLHAHHIKSFKDNESLRYDVNNGITLCGECHRKWHKENGK